MSTKTLRKRIALVAVAALGFGLVSTVPAFAEAATGEVSTITLSTSFNLSLAKPKPGPLLRENRASD